MESGKNYVLGIYGDEDILMKGVKNVREAGVKIEEVFTPYPVHHLDSALGYKRSRLPVAALLFGMTGTSLALLMQIWMLGVDWPMIIGGKQHIALPDFIPVSFELTVLIGALGMVATFLVASDLKPHKKPKIYDVRSTDDKFVMAVDLSAQKLERTEVERILNESGCEEVNEKNFD